MDKYLVLTLFHHCPLYSLRVVDVVADVVEDVLQGEDVMVDIGIVSVIIVGTLITLSNKY